MERLTTRESTTKWFSPKKEKPQEQELVTVMMKGNTTKKAYFKDGLFLFSEHKVPMPQDDVIFWGRHGSVTVPLKYTSHEIR